MQTKQPLKSYGIVWRAKPIVEEKRRIRTKVFHNSAVTAGRGRARDSDGGGLAFRGRGPADE